MHIYTLTSTCNSLLLYLAAKFNSTFKSIYFSFGFFFTYQFLSHCTITVCQIECFRRGLKLAEYLLLSPYYVIFSHNKKIYKLIQLTTLCSKNNLSFLISSVRLFSQYLFMFFLFIFKKNK